MFPYKDMKYLTVILFLFYFEVRFVKLPSLESCWNHFVSVNVYVLVDVMVVNDLESKLCHEAQTHAHVHKLI